MQDKLANVTALNDVLKQVITKNVTVNDLMLFSNEQILNLNQKEIIAVLEGSLDDFERDFAYVASKVGLHIALDLCKESKDSIIDAKFALEYFLKYSYEGLRLLENLQSSLPAAEKIEILNDRIASVLLNADSNAIEDYKLSDTFKNNHPQFFLDFAKLPITLIKAIKYRSLSIHDILEYSDLLTDFDVNPYFDNQYLIDLGIIYGPKSVQSFIKKYPNFFRLLNDNSYIGNDLILAIKQYNKDSNDLDIESFSLVAGNFLCNRMNIPSSLKEDDDRYYLPSWFVELGFSVVTEISSHDELTNITHKTKIMNENQRTAISSLGLDNLKQFATETMIFQKSINFLTLFGIFLKNNHDISLNVSTYENFRMTIAELLKRMVKAKYFTDYESYDFIEGQFRSDFPKIFIDSDAPMQLREKFYRNRILPEDLMNNPDWTGYLIDKDLSLCIGGDFKTNFYDSETFNENEKFQFTTGNFLEEYVNRFGNKAFLNLMTQYGSFASDLQCGSFDLSGYQGLWEQQFKKAIYDSILKRNYKHGWDVLPEEFKQLYPDIFLSENCPNIVKNLFYTKGFSFEILRLNPILAKFLEGKNLLVAFGNANLANMNQDPKKNVSEKDAKISYQKLEKMVRHIPHMDLIRLISTYGIYFGFLNLPDNLYEKYTTYEQFIKYVEYYIVSGAYTGKINYQENAPQFMKERHKELFLDPNAPDELKNYFYKTDSKYLITFSIIKEHPEWIPFLEGKAVHAAFCKNSAIAKEVQMLFDCLKGQGFLKFGLKKPDTVDTMLMHGKTDIMFRWYQKTGCKFIPDYIVMENLSLDEADKFLSNAKSWSRIMKISRYAQNSDGRDALLKLAYVFGLFDSNAQALKKLETFISSAPASISKEEYDNLIKYENHIIQYNLSDDEEMTMPFGLLEYAKLKEEMIVNNISPQISSSFAPSEDGTSYKCLFDYQSNNINNLLRIFMEAIQSSAVFNVEEAHRLFGGFNLKFDIDFREFMLKNWPEIMNDDDRFRNLTAIQKNFQKIKVLYSNMTLTYDLAVNYVYDNKFENVELGNEDLSVICSQVGYTQADFNTLQQIYDLGKQRVFSSIPRVEGKHENFSFEILRLDDPLAIAIGTLTDCCQELNDAAEMCMEHSVVSNCGRVFVVRDEDGNIIAQSWLWRNGNVICFDNIEVPNKAIKRASQIDKEKGTKNLTQKVYDCYKMAAYLLMETDDNAYKNLLEEGKITQEQYLSFKLAKVTVGMGYNDIKSAIQANAVKETGTIARPYRFTAPVQLNRGLYTQDSNTQYIISKSDSFVYNSGNAPSIHSDIFEVLTDQSMTKKHLLLLQKLALQSASNTYDINMQIDDNDNNYVTKIGENYGLFSSKSRIIMNHNIAIIYQDSENKVIIADVLYNSEYLRFDGENLEQSKALLQLNLALEQISKGKVVDVSMLDGQKQRLINQLADMEKTIDYEKGVGEYVRR